MMRRLVVISRCICLAAGLLLSSQLSAAANDDDPYSVNIEQNLATPAVNAKHSVAVSNAMGLLTRTLRQAGFETPETIVGAKLNKNADYLKLFAENLPRFREF